MRRLLSLSAVLALFALPARAEEPILCTLSSTSPTATTGNCSGKTRAARLTVQCDGATYVTVVSSSTGAVTSSTGLLIQANQLYPLDMVANHEWVSILAQSGTSNCKLAAYLGR